MKRVVLVTGGTRGIGRAIAEDLTTDHDVAVVWRSTPPDNLPTDICAIKSDLTRQGSCKTVVGEIITVSGGYRL